MRMEGDLDDHYVCEDGDEDLIAYEEAYNKCGRKVMIMMFMLTMMFMMIMMKISSVLKRRTTSAGGGKARLLAIYVRRPSNQN